MAIFIWDKIGYILWEGLVLFWLVAASIGWLALCRKLTGRAAFSHHDRKLLFDSPARSGSMPAFWLRLSAAVLLFCGVAGVELFVIAPFGAAILAMSLLLSCAGIVNFTLL